jgi:hypothetical protein
MFKIIPYLNSYAPEHSEQKDLSQKGGVDLQM